MALTDDTKCVVNLNHTQIYGIDGIHYTDEYGNETIEQKLQRAIKRKKEDLALYLEHSKNYDREDRTYWADRYKAEKDFNFVIMTLGEFHELERKKYLSMPLKEVTKKNIGRCWKSYRLKIG